MPLKLDMSSAEEMRSKLSQSQETQIRELYEQAARNIAAEAEKAPRVPSDTLRQQYLNALHDQITDAIREVGKDTQKIIQDNMVKTAKAAVDSNKQFLVEVGMPIQGAFSHVPTDVVQSIVTGKLYEGNWSLSKALWRAGSSTQRDVESIIAKGITENRSAYDIAKDLEKYVDPKAVKDWEWSKVYPGTARHVDYNAQRLARTMVSHAYQQSFVRTTQKNPFVTKYKWLSSGGERMCSICEQRNDQYFEKDDLPLDHPNGMCTFVAVIEDSMTDIADRLADWAAGKTDPELDRWAESMYGKGWESVRTESRVPIAKAAVDNLGSIISKDKAPAEGPTNDSNMAFNPLNFSNTMRKLWIKNADTIVADLDHRTTISVNLDKVRTPQYYVYKDTVKSYIDKIANNESLISTSESGVKSGILVFEYNGEYYLYEGNHRAAAYKLLGVDKVSAEKIEVYGLE